VPAPPSSPIPAAQRPAATATLAPEQCRSLLEDLAQIADPRHRRGRRHTLATVLAVAVAAVLAGARSLAAIGEWASDAPDQVLAALGVRRDLLTRAWRPPGEATVRRVLARIDPDALDLAIGRWLADQQPPPPTTRPPPRPAWRQALAVDGKTLRGSGHHQTAPVHLLAVMTTAAVPSWPRPRWTPRPTRSPGSSRCWRAWTLPGGSSLPTPYADIGIRRLMPRWWLCRGGGRWCCCWG